MSLKYIAFYLPQYHPIPENDIWWGNGFTDWLNVVKAAPRFRGHYQPHIPADLGFYDLRLHESRERQAELAKKYSVDAFCYYHYWFNGKQLLNTPFDMVFQSGRPDFPFCLCWANENWTRTWSGGANDILIKQEHSDEDDRNHIKHLLPRFDDQRYIRIDNKPLFLVYRAEALPEPRKTTEIWREEAIKAGIGEIYLAKVENFDRTTAPEKIGFDAAVEFAPDWSMTGPSRFRSLAGRVLTHIVPGMKGYRENEVLQYDVLVRNMLKKRNSYKRFRCVMPSWDNSARREKGAIIFTGSDPEKYKQWLENVSDTTLREQNGDEQIVFINAWNEWAEGAHLEPDQRFGLKFLQAMKLVKEKYGMNTDIKWA